MDRMGCDVLEHFPDWQRATNNSLKLYNKSSHRLFFLAPGRSHLQFHGTQPASEHVQFASDLHDAFQKRMPVESLERIGIRFWFALSFGHSSERMVKQLQKIFFLSNDKISGILDAKIEDNIFSVDLKSESGWKQHFVFGPMKQKEWLQNAQVDQILFSEGDKNDSYKNFVDGIPSDVLYVDCDYYRENVPSVKFRSIVEEASQLVSNRVKRLIDYYKNG